MSVELKNDDSLTGLGHLRTIATSGPAVLPTLRQELAPRLKGKDAVDVSEGGAAGAELRDLVVAMASPVVAVPISA